MISILIPFHNEEKNLPILYKDLLSVLSGISYEIIFIDDGYEDNSSSNVKAQISKQEGEKIKLIRHPVRLGKGKALLSGFKESIGDTIIFMDGDLQDDPTDIKKFLNKIDQGADLVNGWRKTRKDKLDKTLPSKILNKFLTKILFSTSLHDINCGFKAMRRRLLEQIPLYGDNYRFIPILAEKKGFSVREVEVNHRPRKYGQSKYNFVRLFFGFIDALNIYFISRFSERPLHFFSIIGGLFFAIGFIIAGYLSYQRIFYGVFLYRRPALLFAILLIIVGLQIILTGIVAELIVYLHNKRPTNTRG